MPYRDREQQLAAKAASARRRRAKERGTAVEPDAPLPAPTPAMLRAAGVVLHVGRGDRESDQDYLCRLRKAWHALLSVVG